MIERLDETKFEDAVGTGVALVDFGAEWCGPCQTMLPVVERLAEELNGTVSVYAVDIDQSPALAARHGVMSVPTFLIFRDGEEVDRMIGTFRARDIRERIDMVREKVR